MKNKEYNKGYNDQNTKIIILPGETLSPQVIERLKRANHIKKKKTFSWYKTEIYNIFSAFLPSLFTSSPFSGPIDCCKTKEKIRTGFEKKKKQGIREKSSMRSCYPLAAHRIHTEKVLQQHKKGEKVKKFYIKYTSVKYKTFYGGFVVGEGSINVSIKKSTSALFGILLDPEFSITQHVNGFEFLFAALYLFETGSIHYKSGSNATLVYRIDNRTSLYEKVIPFWETYILPYQYSEGQQRIILFKRILFFLEQKKHKDKAFFVNKMLPIWDKLRKQKGQINQTFPSLEAATEFALLVSSSAETRK